MTGLPPYRDIIVDIIANDITNGIETFMQNSVSRPSVNDVLCALERVRTRIVRNVARTHHEEVPWRAAYGSGE